MGWQDHDIQQRVFDFALRILRVVRALPDDVAGRTIARQIARSGTSVGANLEEAQGAPTRREFARRIAIARSEAIETRYWLRLIAESEMLPTSRLAELTQECDELVKVLSTIVRNTRNAEQEDS